MMIYVAGPYTADTESGIERNCARAIEVGLALLAKGHCPVIPHLGRLVDLHLDLSGGDRPSWQAWMDWTHEMLVRCDALYFVGSSRGADIERGIAEQRGMPIYERMEDVP